MQLEQVPFYTCLLLLGRSKYVFSSTYVDIVVYNIYGTYKQSSDVGLITTLWERIVWNQQ